MIVTLAGDAPASTVNAILQAAAAAGHETRTLNDGHGSTVIGITGTVVVSSLPGIRSVQEKHRPYMLASREARPHAPTIVKVGHVRIGGGRPIVMAGPCVIETREALLEAALATRAAGADMLRGGAYKPRTSPYSFQGLGEDGLRFLAEARELTGLPVVTEVMEPDQVELVAHYADMLQVGARNMANFPLLRKLGQANKPVLLKRGFSATIEEWLMSAEYVMAHGNPNVVLCERGIRGFDPATRFTLDLTAVPLIKELSHLPIIVDPSHGTGRRSLVGRMALAGLTAGADGLIIEALPNPDGAACDAAQTITTGELATIIESGRLLHSMLLSGMTSEHEAFVTHHA
ncbi:MAG: 3-deoxy-7-phosphoheptulonate synthase [Thermomicrobiales bacterium]|nr:3-deoxy-7-phosphoheptulonate synthase [Thermomicrobiales bacterium]